MVDSLCLCLGIWTRLGSSGFVFAFVFLSYISKISLGPAVYNRWFGLGNGSFLESLGFVLGTELRALWLPHKCASITGYLPCLSPLSETHIHRLKLWLIINSRRGPCPDSTVFWGGYFLASFTNKETERTASYTAEMEFTRRCVWFSDNACYVTRSFR